MNRRIALGLVALAVLLPCPPAGGAEERRASIEELSWLAGCWESARGDRRIEEQWMAPRGGTMLGMSRTVAGGRTVAFEFLQVREDGGRFVFTARPSGQPEASFTSVEITGSRVVFENKAHDFPQRIIYRIVENGSLAARIEGERDGKVTGVDFPMNRADCAGGARR